MQPKACIPPPEGDSDPMEQLLDAGGGVLGVDYLGNGLPERPIYACAYLYCRYAHEGGKQMSVTSERSVF